MRKMSEEKIINEINILKQKPQLRRQERRYLQKLESKLSGNQINSSESKGKPLNIKLILSTISIVVLSLSAIVGITWYISSRPSLPPINMAGHIEENPSSHILNTKMPESIQKHMLEHADGKGKPGVLIQYNCKKYNCEKDLIEKLKVLVKKYPENVYLAPGNYDGKIILTRLNKREILKKFDGKIIITFIKN